MRRCLCVCVPDLLLKEQQSQVHSPWRKLFGLRKATQRAQICANVCLNSAK